MVNLLLLQVGAVATLFDDRSWAVRANIGSAGRIPTLNELFWIPGGNPMLRPDHSIKSEYGVHYEKNILGEISLDGDGFLINTTNLIVWEPGANGVWAPINIDQVHSSGVEWSANWKPTQYLSAEFAQQLTDAIKEDASFLGDASQGKQLPYVPRETVHAFITFAFPNNDLIIHGNADFASFRYITSDNTQFIPGYPVYSASFESHFTVGHIVFTPELTCNNITNVAYQVFPGYPMPQQVISFFNYIST